MDNPTTLLVAIMFVTIVVTGIVNILMFISNPLAGGSRASTLVTVAHKGDDQTGLNQFYF